MDKLMEQQAVSEVTKDSKVCKIAGDTNTVKYGEYKVVSTFSDTGESITDLL